MTVQELIEEPKDSVVKEILKEIENRMNAFEVVSACIDEGSLNGGLRAAKECEVAYSVLSILHSYISDTWGE